jgi:hypothetical protein
MYAYPVFFFSIEIECGCYGQAELTLSFFLLQIYMISSINHHVSILHLRVHRRYLDILTYGDSTFPATEGEPWHVLKLQRTRWFDLLDTNDRIEALKGVWQLFHHQLRQTRHEGDVPVPIELPLERPL